MAETPPHDMSNYGWSLWHLEQAQAAHGDPEAVALHLGAAQARATLALADEHSTMAACNRAANTARGATR